MRAKSRTPEAAKRTSEAKWTWYRESDILLATGHARNHRLLRSWYESATGWIREAVAISPSSLTLHGTLGSLLVETGNPKEAEPSLRRVHLNSLSLTDQSISAFYLALLERNRGRHRAAHRLAQESFREQGQKWLQARLAKEFPAVTKSAGNPSAMHHD